MMKHIHVLSGENWENHCIPSIWKSPASSSSFRDKIDQWFCYVTLAKYSLIYVPLVLINLGLKSIDLLCYINFILKHKHRLNTWNSHQSMPHFTLGILLFNAALIVSKSEYIVTILILVHQERCVSWQEQIDFSIFWPF